MSLRMSSIAPMDPHASTPLESALVQTSPRARVRVATDDDVPVVAAAVRELLLELGATAPSVRAMQTAAQALIDDRGTGVLLVAEAEGNIVGVLAASLQTAMHVPGRYVLIQDLWVH